MSTTRYVDVETALQNLEDSELSKTNVGSIQRFIDNLAAEGISEVRQRRLITCLKSLLRKIAPSDFELENASEQELKTVIASLNRSDYAESTKHTMRCAVKKFYKVENGGHEHPEKVDFFSVHNSRKPTSVTRDDLFTKDELKKLFRSFQNTRDKAFTMVLYESASRPGELLETSIGDFTSNEKGDFIFLQGLKDTPDRTNQLVRSGRTLREWISQHPLGGELGDIEDSSAPLFVKTEQLQCSRCHKIPRNHSNNCDYKPDKSDRYSYASFRQRFKQACERAGIPDNKRRPYNLRHTRLTEVATFMGYEQLNKFAGWKPGSDRAKVYVHLNNDDVNQSIREEYGISNGEDEEKSVTCSFCGTENQSQYSDCRTCSRILSLKQESEKQEKLEILERLAELEEKEVLKKLEEHGRQK